MKLWLGLEQQKEHVRMAVICGKATTLAMVMVLEIAVAVVIRAATIVLVVVHTHLGAAICAVPPVIQDSMVRIPGNNNPIMALDLTTRDIHSSSNSSNSSSSNKSTDSSNSHRRHSLGTMLPGVGVGVVTATLVMVVGTTTIVHQE